MPGPVRIHANSVIQVAPSATVPTQIVGPNPARTSVLIVNLTGAQLVYLGQSQALTTATGVPLAASVGSNVTFYSQDAVWGLSAVSAQTLSVWEEYAAGV